MSRTKVKIDVLFGVLAFFLPLFLYMSTLCPTVPVGDGGELTCAAYSLGIAHPTGYPLFCLWGRIFILVLPLANIALRINMMSALFASLAAVLVFFLARELFLKMFPDGRLVVPAVALVTALIFSFSETMWSQAVQAEVYTLHAFLVAALILIMVLWRRTADGRLAYLWAFLWGLSLGNHTSVIILLGPALYMALFRGRRQGLKRHLPGMVLFFMMGISLYLYLPLRSAANPPHDWGNPETLGRLWDHVSARQYRRFFLFAFPLDVWHNLGHYVGLLIDQFGVLLFGLSLIGAMLQGAKWRGLFVLFLLIGLSNVVLSASYDIQDIEAYYLPSYLIFSLWLGLALSQGLRWLLSRHRSKAIGFVAAAVLVALAAIPLVANFSRASQRGRTIAREYGLNILSSVEPGAVLLTASDNESFPILYLHDVEGVRSDISVFDLGSTVERMRRFLGLKGVTSEGNPGRLRRMVVEQTRRPVFFTKEHMSAGTDVLQMDDLSLEPFGLVYRLRRGVDQALETQLPWAKYDSKGLESARQLRDYRIQMMVANYHLSWGEDLWVRGDTSTALEQFALAQRTLEGVEKAKIHNEMGVFFRRIGWAQGARWQFERALICPQKTRMDESHIHVNLGNLLVDLGRKDLAQKEMALALTIWPGNRTAQFNLARLRANEHLEQGRFGSAARELEKMLALDPDDATICYNLGLIYGRRLQELEKARDRFRRCLALDSDGPVGAAAKAEMVRLELQMRNE
jgi:tetratricopeptide (TPR) repeat protein